MQYITALPLLKEREQTSHKGTFGTVLGIGGSRGMAGAVALAGKAALMSGAGLCRIAVPDAVLETTAGFFPELTTIPCKDDKHGRFSMDAQQELVKQLGNATATFLGPGLGRSAGLAVLVKRLVQHCIQHGRPLVADADALNALAESGFFTKSANCHSSVILTPHAGEFERLRKQPTPPETDENGFECRQNAAAEFARQHNVVLVLKGHRTIITDGEHLAVNTAGNAGMATGGSGDVLTGIITGLSAQRYAPLEAAQLGVFLHGKAGNSAAAQLGEASVTASAILACVRV